MKNRGWESSKVTESLRKQISEYVEGILTKEIPHIPFYGYQQFVKKGSRKEFEEAYFNVRKQLTALGLYLMWDKKETALIYFNELLWSVTNEFSWCLVAHLGVDVEGFPDEPGKSIDLFAAETAATLSELSVLHADIIDPMLRNHMIKQVKEQVLTPFLEQEWGWETSLNNWCAVCSGSIGMAALLIESDDRKEKILEKVERALTYYLRCFGSDGETVEGIGYWVYGFGYYIYYTAMRKEMDLNYEISNTVLEKLKKIAQLPMITQISEGTFLPFSDAAKGTLIPTGLTSYLYKEYGVNTPVVKDITPFDFDHCYRFAHISRNLWWTDSEIFDNALTPVTKYFKDAQWLIQRYQRFFFAAKGGSNAEEHNHNDVGSIIFAVDDELLLTDLGAGPYTAEYFGTKRYEYPNTRSYWHNVPLIQEKEQAATSNECIVHEVLIDGEKAEITMEVSGLYMMPELKSMKRKIHSDMGKKTIILQDELVAEKELLFEEGYVSVIKPIRLQEGYIQWKGKKGKLVLQYDASLLIDMIEEKLLPDHLGKQEMVYRLGLRMKQKNRQIATELIFEYSSYD